MLFLVVFMIHEYEEIIMFRRWIDRNRGELRKRFPKIEFVLYSTWTFRLFHFHLCRWNCSRVHTCFCCFVLLGLDRSISIVVCCIDRIFRSLVMHIVQWIVYRKYVPVIITSLLTLPYCIYSFVEFSKVTVLSFSQMVLWAVIGIVLTILSVFSAFFFMDRFQRWEEGNNKK